MNKINLYKIKIILNVFKGNTVFHKVLIGKSQQISTHTSHLTVH